MQSAINKLAKATHCAGYAAAPLGGSPVQLLSLAVKKNQPWWKRSFRPSVKVLFANLQDLTEPSIAQNQLSDFLVTSVRKSSDSKEIATRSELKDLEITLDEMGKAKIKFKNSQFPCDLEVGELTEESLNDQDLSELLQMAELDQRWVEEYDFKNQTIFIVTGILYSERLKVVDEQKSETEMQYKMSLPGVIKIGKLYRRHPFSPLVREGEGPLMFKYKEVKYDSQKNRLHLAKDSGSRRIITPGCRLYLPSGENEEDYEVIDIVQDHSLEDLCHSPTLQHTVGLLQKLFNGVTEVHEMKITAQAMFSCLERLMCSSDTNFHLESRDITFLKAVGCAVKPLGDRNVGYSVSKENTIDETVQEAGAVLKEMQTLTEEDWVHMQEIFEDVKLSCTKEENNDNQEPIKMLDS